VGGRRLAEWKIKNKKEKKTKMSHQHMGSTSFRTLSAKQAAEQRARGQLQSGIPMPPTLPRQQHQSQQQQQQQQQQQHEQL